MKSEFKYFIWLISLGIMSIIYLESRFVNHSLAKERMEKQDQTNLLIIEGLKKLDKRLYDIHKDMKK